MNRNIARCLYGVLFAGGLTVLGATAATAAESSGDDSILSGTVVDAVVSIPVTLNGTSVSIVGDSSSGNASAPAPAVPAAPASITSGDDSVLGGTNAAPLISIPVNLGGNAVSVLGESTTSNSTTDGSAPVPAPAPAASQTSGDGSVGGGTNVVPIVTVPIAVSGNAISVLGDSVSEGSTTEAVAPVATGGAGSDTSGIDGILGGTLVSPNVTLPVTVGGNAISVIGDSTSTASTTDVVASAPAAPVAGAGTSGDDGILGGTLVAPNVTAPVNVGGNGISLIGDSTSNGSTTDVVGATPVAPAAGAGTSGDESILGGTIIAPVIELPVTIGGNAISVIGDTETTDSVVVPTTPTTPVSPTAPSTPTDPTSPVGPATPAIPVDPTEPASAIDSTTPFVGAATMVSASGATASAATAAVLASSGADEVAKFLGLSALLLFLGAAAVMVARKRTASA